MAKSLLLGFLREGPLLLLRLFIGHDFRENMTSPGGHQEDAHEATHDEFRPPGATKLELFLWYGHGQPLSHSIRFICRCHISDLNSGCESWNNLGKPFSSPLQAVFWYRAAAASYVGWWRPHRQRLRRSSVPNWNPPRWQWPSWTIRPAKWKSWSCEMTRKLGIHRIVSI